MITLSLTALLFAGNGDLVFADSFESVGGGVIECHEIEGFRFTPVVFVVNLNQTATTYEQLFGPWGAASNSLDVKLGATQYTSLPMTVPDSGSAFLTWDEQDGNPDQLRVSVSPCKGPPIIETAVPQTGMNSCFLQSNGRIGGFGMVTPDQNSASIECELAPGDYFLNFGWIDAAGGRGCDTSSCIWNVQEN